MLLPLGVFAPVAYWRTGAVPEAMKRLAWSAALTVVVLGLAGALAGRGPGAWIESAQRLRVHTSAVGPNAIGLKVPFATSLANLRGDLVDSASLYNYERIAIDVAATARAHALLIVFVTAGLLGLAVRLAWTTRDSLTAFVAGVAVVYALTTPSCYYGSIFVLLLLVRPVRTTAVFLSASMLMYMMAGAVLALSRAGTIRLNGAAVYAPVSVLLLLVLAYWFYDMRAADGPLKIASADAICGWRRRGTFNVAEANTTGAFRGR